MIGWLAAAALAGAPIGIDRVDVLAEAPALWVSQELPRFTLTPRVGAVRFLTQVQPVVWTPLDGLQLGLSLQAQTLLYERPVLPHAGLHVTGGLVTRAGLPAGLQLGAAWRPGKVRLGLSAVALSGASWARPDWTTWRLLPGVGLGFGRDPRPRAPWMEE